MTLVRSQCAVLVSVLSGLLWINHIEAAECDLEKTFRTPKDMSKVNFDHFEIVERNAFDRFEPTTTPPTTEGPSTATKTTKKNGANVANAQVLVRFGGDDVHGSNHIMKIPPQCRHHVGDPLASPYYPPFSPHYYHPYPPPVPFAFPNYYFLNCRNEAQYLPLQLREYFRKHPEFLGPSHPSERDDDTLPLRRTDFSTHGEFIIDAKPKAFNTGDFPTASFPSSPKVGVVLLRPRIMKPLDLTNEDIEENIVAKSETKTACADSKKPAKVVQNDISIASEETKKVAPKPAKQSKESEEHLEKLLNEALVAYRCNNCSQPSKMLVSYPIVNKPDNAKPNDVVSGNCPYCQRSGKFPKDIAELGSFNTQNVANDCKCVNCQCKKNIDKVLNGKRFAKDIDDLIAVVLAEIIDPEPLSQAPKNDDYSHLFPDFIPPVIPVPKLTHIGLDVADEDYKNIHQIPLKASLDLDCASSFGYGTQRAATSPYGQLNRNPPKIPYYSERPLLSESGFKSDPHTIVVYQAPTQLKSLDLEENIPLLIPSRKFTSPDSYFATRKLVSKENPGYLPAPICNEPKRGYLPTRPPTRSTMDDLRYSPYNRPIQYFFAEPNVQVKQVVEKPVHPLPKYLKVIPRDDLEIVPPAAPVPLASPDVLEPKVRYEPSRLPINYCKNCGQRHSGGNFCCKCGAPLVIYSSAVGGSYCPRCPKETRQLNDW